MEDEAALLRQMGTDASKWAKEFYARFPFVDEGVMLAWFANAIEAGRDADRKRVGK